MYRKYAFILAYSLCQPVQPLCIYDFFK